MERSDKGAPVTTEQLVFLRFPVAQSRRQPRNAFYRYAVSGITIGTVTLINASRCSSEIERENYGPNGTRLNDRGINKLELPLMYCERNYTKFNGLYNGRYKLRLS